jgi:polyphenol oxidase
VRLERRPLQEAPDGLAFWDFPPCQIDGAAARDPRPAAVREPRPADARTPRALLSLASAGSMRFLGPRGNPERTRLFGELGLEEERTLALELAHSRNVVFPEGAADFERLADQARLDGGADGIVLRDPGLVATVTVADCMPIWILDRSSGAFGVLHSGWKGTGILARAVEELERRFGTCPESVSVILGPAIGPCCYDVPGQRAEAFGAEFGPASIARRGGRPYLDLLSANLAIAERLGLGSALAIEACTFCDPRFGSYRRQGPGAFTRMLAACGHFGGDRA